MAHKSRQIANIQPDDQGSMPPLTRIVCSLSAIALCAKAFGLAEKFVIAHYFGTSETTDVYFASTAILFSIVFLLKELVYPSFLPVFSECVQGPMGLSAGLFKQIFLSASVVLILVALALVVFPNRVAALFMPGFTGERLHLTTSMLRYLGPSVVCLGLATISYTALNARRKFLCAAWPEAGLKLFVVLALVGLAPILGIHSYPLALLLGSVICLGVQLCFLPERSVLFTCSRQNLGQSIAYRRMLLLMSPLVLGVVFSHISGLVDNWLASRLPSGQLSFLGYSKKLTDSILLIGPVALVTVVFSQLSHLASRKDRKQFTDLVSRAIRLIIYLSVPAGCLLLVVGQPLIRLLLQRGQFDAESTLGTTHAFVIYMLGLTVFSLEPLLVHSFFALSDTKTPVKIGVLCVLLDIVLALILVRRFEYLGIAGAFLLSKTVKVFGLAYLLDKRLEGLFAFGLAHFVVKQGVIAGSVWCASRLILSIGNAESLPTVVMFDILFPSLGALAVWLCCSHALGSEEFRMVLALLMRKKRVVETLVGGSK